MLSLHIEIDVICSISAHDLGPVVIISNMENDDRYAWMHIGAEQPQRKLIYESAHCPHSYKDRNTSSIVIR